MNEPLRPNRRLAAAADRDPDEFVGLPAWLYRDEEFFAHEAERLFRPSWQIVCHVNDIAGPGDYHTFDFLGESILVLRGGDRAVRAFHNVCRHRASRLVDGPSGRCGFRITCPYHAWSYDLEGNLTGVPFRETFNGLDPASHGLKPVELEVFEGFIFVRLAGGGPSVAEMMAPYAQEIAAYRMEEMVPLGRVTLRPREVNWKNVADNYSDGLHINVAHPGLTRLFGKGYGIEASEWVDKMWGSLRDQPSSSRSERMYQKYLPKVAHLPAERQRLWTYFKLWPNVAFDIYPDQIDFMQFVPVSATRTLIREIAYAHPDGRREMKAARYLNWRINRQVNKEDTTLINRVQAGMGSSSYDVGPLGSTEVCLRNFTRKFRALMPVARRRHAPAPGWSRRPDPSGA
jgi:phenylpropionate dioxygenase-like ring-hydroxylating dioxygenase large terminal subunit